MRKGLVYGILLSAALLIPTNHVELAKMRPVETVRIRNQDEWIVIETDTEDTGRGSTLEEAVKDLRDTAAGRVYVDTAQYLIVEEAAESQIGKLKELLKPGVRVCIEKGEIDMQTVGEYLRAHSPEMKLKNWQTGSKLQVLEGENGRLKLK